MEKARNGFVDGLGVLGMLGHVGMLIPARVTAVVVAVVDLDVAHAGLDQSARHEALLPEGVGFWRSDAVKGFDGGGFAGKIGEFRGAALHPISQFKGVDRGFDLIFKRRSLGLAAVESLQQAELASLGGRRKARVGDVGNLNVLEGLLGLADGGSLMDGGEEGVAVVLRPSHAFGGHDGDEGGHVFVFAPQPVAYPAADGRADEVHRSGVQKQSSRPVGNSFGVHSVEKAEIVHVFGYFGEEGGDGLAALPSSLKVPQRFHHGSPGHLPKIIEAIAENVHFALMVFYQPRFVVEAVYVAGTSLHEEKDHPFGAGRKVGRLGFQRVGGCPKGVLTKPGQGKRTEAAGGSAKHFPAGYSGADLLNFRVHVVASFFYFKNLKSTEAKSE